MEEDVALGKGECVACKLCYERGSYFIKSWGMQIGATGQS